MLRTRIIAVATTVCILLTPVGARADNQAVIDAQARFEDGLDRARRGDFDGARLAFVQAYSVLRSPEILYNLAVAEQKTQHTLEALRHFRQLMREPRAGKDDRAAAQSKIDQLTKVTGHLRVEAPEGVIVAVDGQAATLNEDPIDVMPGAHVIDGRLGAKTARAQASPAAGETIAVKLAIAPDPPRLAEEPREPRGRIPVTLALGVAALAALGVGIGFAIDSQSKKDDVDAYRDAHPKGFCATGASATCTEYQGMLDDQQRSVTAANVLYVSSGVLAAFAVGAFVLWPRSKVKSERAFIAPTFGGARAGFTF